MTSTPLGLDRLPYGDGLWTGVLPALGGAAGDIVTFPELGGR